MSQGKLCSISYLYASAVDWVCADSVTLLCISSETSQSLSHGQSETQIVHSLQNNKTTKIPLLFFKRFSYQCLLWIYTVSCKFEIMFLSHNGSEIFSQGCKKSYYPHKAFDQPPLSVTAVLQACVLLKRDIPHRWPLTAKIFEMPSK